jgi:transketolase
MTLFDGAYAYDQKEYPVIRDGDDVAIFANGCMIREALIASEQLAKEGTSARVIDMHTVKPLARDCILRNVRETGRVVSVEEHNIIGGAGGALAELLMEEYPVPMRRVGVRDTFGRSGSVDALFELLGISSRYISEAVHTLIRDERR